MGHLTSATLLEAGAVFPRVGGLHADAGGTITGSPPSGSWTLHVEVVDAKHVRVATTVTLDVSAARQVVGEEIHPAHLDGYLRSRRGEFRLVALPAGGTRLEGSTWYTLDMQPDPYWRLWTDGLIGAIHHRVLRHVKRLSEER